MVKESSGGDRIRLLAAVKFHEHFGSSTGHAETPLAVVNVMAPS